MTRMRAQHQSGLSWMLFKGILLLTLATLPIWSTETFAQQATSAEAGRLSEAELEVIREGYADRSRSLIETQSDKPLKRGNIGTFREPGRGKSAGRYAMSLAGYAAANFLMNQNIPLANDALVEYADFFLANPQAIYDRDNFHWHAEVPMRLIEFYGVGGSKNPGLLTPSTEEKLLEAIWLYCKRRQQDQPAYKTISEADHQTSGTWFIYESENHHAQSFCTQWHFAKLARQRDQFQNRVYDDGRTAEAHYRDWCDYLKMYFAERAKKGMFIEMMCIGYNKELLRGMFNIYDFSDVPELKRRAGLFFDLYFAYWGQEQFNGVSGGGKSRVYTDHVLPSSEYGYLFFGVGQEPSFSCSLVTSLTTQYRPPLVVVDLVCDSESRGCYEVWQRPLGLAEGGFFEPPIYHLNTQFGGMARYSYCTPDFIMGSTMYEARPREDWTLISSQNRAQGVIFADHPQASIMLRCDTDSNNRAYNTNWSVQKMGTLICQKLQANQRGGDMRVWFSDLGLSAPVEHQGWIFTHSQGAYAGVKVVHGSYRWEDSPSKTSGKWLICSDEYSPVIVECDQQSEYQSFDDFQQQVISNPLTFQNKVLTYESLSGDQLTFYADYSNVPLINQTPVDLKRPMAFESPFLNASWNSGVVTLQSQDRELTLNFNDPTPPAESNNLTTPPYANCKKIFNGENFEGWVADPSTWSIVDGAMRGDAGTSRLAYTNEDYGSFRLIFTARMNPPNKDHLGVLFWGDRPVDPAKPKIDNAGWLQFMPPNGSMWNYHPPQHKNLPHETLVKTKKDYSKWSTTELLFNLEKGTMRAAVDGVEIVRYTHPEPLERTDPETRILPGPIGMFRHGNGVSEYKDIYVEVDPREDRLITVPNQE